ncbi:MAG: hypothetical protein QM747_21815 [Nocardioides sp.]
MSSTEAGPAVTTYRLAPGLAVRQLGLGLVALAVVVLVLTVAGAVVGFGWVPAGVVAVAGIVLVAVRGWYVARAWAVRLGPEGYAVRMLGGIGANAAAWSAVDEVLASSPGGRPCLVLRLHDGRATTLPMAAVAADPDRLARDVRRRVRDAHTPTTP